MNCDLEFGPFGRDGDEMSAPGGFPHVAETLVVENEASTIFCLDRIPGVDRAILARRPFTTRILIENLLRNFAPKIVDPKLVERLASGAISARDEELPFFPGVSSSRISPESLLL